MAQQGELPTHEEKKPTVNRISFVQPGHATHACSNTTIRRFYYSIIHAILACGDQPSNTGVAYTYGSHTVRQY